MCRGLEACALAHVTKVIALPMDPTAQEEARSPPGGLHEPILWIWALGTLWEL